MLSSPSNYLRVQRLVLGPTKRDLHDVVTHRPGAKVAVQYGPPGRSAVTGHVATVFGCTGFLGRYLVSKLAKAGTQVIVPYRDEDEKRHLRVMGDLGQIVPMEWDARNELQIEECLRHSDIVYNLVGRDYETKNFDYRSVHVTSAQSIAKVAAQNGVSKLVHVSHLNASLDSTSKFYQTKAEGELAVKEAFSDATIIRPSIMFGYEDRLLNSMAAWPMWWKLNEAQTKIRPVHVLDVAQALTNLLSTPVLSRTVNLPGPSTLSYEYLLDLICSITYNPPSRSPILPKVVAKFLARSAQAVWWPLITPDEVERRYINDSEAVGDWDAVGVIPDEIEPHAITYLRRYRSADNYTRPIVFPSRTTTTYRII